MVEEEEAEETNRHIKATKRPFGVFFVCYLFIVLRIGTHA